MASNCKYFDEDSVYRITRKGRIEFGLVLENAEYVTSEDEDEVAANVPQWDRMKRGHVRVAWHPKGREEVLSERKVRLHDRSLMPGDVVRKVVKGKDTQLGYCRNTEIYAAIQVLGTNCVINNVNSVDLKALERFSQDVAIYLDSWVGIVQSVKTELTLRFPDGSTCVLQEDDALDLDDSLDRRLPSSEFKDEGFYKGQKLCGPMRCFEAARWLNCTKETTALLSRPHKLVHVTVEDVKVVYLFVQGVCKAFQDTSNANNQSDELIKYVIEGDALDRVKMINIFERCALQIGDRNYYTLKATDNICSLEEWRRQCASKYSPPQPAECVPQGPQGPEGESTRQPVAPVASHGDTLDMSDNNKDAQPLAQDGSDSDYEDVDDDASGSDTVSVTSGSTASSVDTHRLGAAFRRGKHGPSLATKLLKKRKLRRPRRRRLPQEQPSFKPGDVLVTETLATSTTAQVVWQDGSVESGIPSSELYPIHHLDGHEFFPGDFVVENTDEPPPHEYGVVKRVDHSGRTAVVTMFKTYMAGAEPHPEELGVQEVSVYDIKDHPDFKYRPASCVIRVANFEDKESESTAGQVVDVHPAGKVEVQWVSGKTSLCYPQELYRIGEYDSDDLWDDGDDDEGDDESSTADESWETESENSHVGDLDLMSPGDDMHISAELIQPPPIDGSGVRDEGGEGESSPVVIVQPTAAQQASAAATGAEEPLDPQSLRAKMQGQIELLRLSMARLEETFTQNPTQQSCSVVRRLLELYRHCKHFDQLLGTNYFQQRSVHVLVERIRQRGRINSPQHVSEQITRLFSASLDGGALNDDDTIPEENNALNRELQVLEEAQPLPPAKEESGQHPTAPQPRKPTSVSCRLEGSGVSMEPRNICQQLCAILKARLLRAHEDVQVRFGMTPAQVQMAATDAASVLSSADFSVVEEPAEPPASTETTPKESEESLPSAAEEGTEEEAKGLGVFSVMNSVPDSHKYKLSILQPHDPKLFFKVVRKEIKLLTSSLPDGIHVKAFDDRMDLYSVLIRGPCRTPYEDGLFLFDFQLPAEYPQSPPLCHYVSYCSDRLNPNLYEGGKVCVSLLGTWGGKGSEMWSAATSSLLQVLISIQGLILVSEPYYNEAGYEQQRGSQQASENSRMYNEMVVLKLVQSMGRMIQNPPEVFKEEIEQHFKDNATRFVNRLESWLRLSDAWHLSSPDLPATPETLRAFAEKGEYGAASGCAFPDFPLLPASRGFCLTLRKTLTAFKEILSAHGLGCPADGSQSQ